MRQCTSWKIFNCIVHHVIICHTISCNISDAIFDRQLTWCIVLHELLSTLSIGFCFDSTPNSSWCKNCHIRSSLCCSFDKLDIRWQHLIHPLNSSQYNTDPIDPQSWIRILQHFITLFHKIETEHGRNVTVTCILNFRFLPLRGNLSRLWIHPTQQRLLSQATFVNLTKCSHWQRRLFCIRQLKSEESHTAE